MAAGEAAGIRNAYFKRPTRAKMPPPPPPRNSFSIPSLSSALCLSDLGDCPVQASVEVWMEPRPPNARALVRLALSSGDQV